MSIRFPPAPPAAAAMGPRIAEGLTMIGEPTPPEAPLTLVAPLPVYAPSRPAGGGRAMRWRPTKLWRALVLSNGAPVATVEFSAAEKPGQVSVRGRDSARALFDALSLAEEFGAAHEERYDIGFVVMPRLFITAVRLKGPRSVYFPTRTGGAERDAPRLFSGPVFRKLFHRTRTRMRRALRTPGRPASREATNGPPA